MTSRASDTARAGTVSAAVTDLLVAGGVPERQARVTARAMVLADVWGIGSHGILRLPSYLRRMDAGGINVAARMREVRRSGSVVSFDGDAGIGHWQVWQAVDVALRIAKTEGVAVAAVGNSSHCGALGVYAARIRAAGGAGIVVSNGPAAIPAPNGRRPLLSTAPVAGTAGPADGPLVDLALAAVTRGHIASLARAGTQLEPGQAFDEHGWPTTDPVAALEGMIAPIGGPKGFALAYLFEALTALVGPGLSIDVVDPFAADRSAEPQRVTHLVAVLRSDAIDLDGHAADRVRRLKAATSESGGRVPGIDRRLVLAGRIRLDQGLRTELVAWAQRLGAHTAEQLLTAA